MLNICTYFCCTYCCCKFRDCKVSGGDREHLSRAETNIALHHACSLGLLDVAQRLHSEGASFNAADDEDTSLHVACINGHLEVAQWLHSVSASVNATMH